MCPGDGEGPVGVSRLPAGTGPQDKPPGRETFGSGWGVLPAPCPSHSQECVGGGPGSHTHTYTHTHMCTCRPAQRSTHTCTHLHTWTQTHFQAHTQVLLWSPWRNSNRLLSDFLACLLRGASRGAGWFPQPQARWLGPDVPRIHSGLRADGLQADLLCAAASCGCTGLAPGPNAHGGVGSAILAKAPGLQTLAAFTGRGCLHGSPREVGRPRLALGVQVEEPSTGKATRPVGSEPTGPRRPRHLSEHTGYFRRSLQSLPSGPIPSTPVSAHTRVEYTQNGPSHPVC